MEILVTRALRFNEARTTLKSDLLSLVLLQYISAGGCLIPLIYKFIIY